jgi:hypothetical protein
MMRSTMRACRWRKMTNDCSKATMASMTLAERFGAPTTKARFKTTPRSPRFSAEGGLDKHNQQQQQQGDLAASSPSSTEMKTKHRNSVTSKESSVGGLGITEHSPNMGQNQNQNQNPSQFTPSRSGKGDSPSRRIALFTFANGGSEKTLATSMSSFYLRFAQGAKAARVSVTFVVFYNAKGSPLFRQSLLQEGFEKQQLGYVSLLRKTRAVPVDILMEEEKRQAESVDSPPPCLPLEGEMRGASIFLRRDAAAMLANEDAELRARLIAFRAHQTETVLGMELPQA